MHVICFFSKISIITYEVIFLFQYLSRGDTAATFFGIVPSMRDILISKVKVEHKDYKLDLFSHNHDLVHLNSLKSEELLRV